MSSRGSPIHDHQIGELALFNGSQLFFQAEHLGADAGAGLDGLKGEKPQCCTRSWSSCRFLPCRLKGVPASVPMATATPAWRARQMLSR